MKQENRLAMDLQLFATAGEEEQVKEEGQEAEVSSQEDSKRHGNGRTFTQAEVNTMIQERIERERIKAEEAKQAEKYQKMKDADKVKALEAQLEELQAKENHREMVRVAKEHAETLEADLPEQIVEALVVDANAERTKDNIEAFALVFKNAVEQEVKNTLKGSSPFVSVPQPKANQTNPYAQRKNEQNQQTIKSNWT